MAKQQRTKEQATEQKILAAARKVFIKHGFTGARMQDIADEAGINKALLHYYFRTKDQLFELVFREAAAQFLPAMTGILTSELPLEGKIEKFVVQYISLLQEHPFIPGFVLHEIRTNPERLPQLLPFDKIDIPALLTTQLEKGIRAGKFRKIPPKQFVANIISLCVFPFVAKPMLQFGLNMPTEEEFEQFIEERKKVVVQFIFNAIKK